MYLRLVFTWSASRSWSWSWITLIFARGNDTCPILPSSSSSSSVPRYFQLSQAKPNWKWNQLSTLPKFSTVSSQISSVKIRICPPCLAADATFACIGRCWLVYSYSAIQPFSYARYFCLKTTITATKHLDTASNHAFACKFASHRWRNMPGICMQIYLLDATRLETWVLHRFRYCHRSVLLHSSLPPICQSVSYRMTYCKYMYIITHTHTHIQPTLWCARAC